MKQLGKRRSTISLAGLGAVLCVIILIVSLGLLTVVHGQSGVAASAPVVGNDGDDAAMTTKDAQQDAALAKPATTGGVGAPDTGDTPVQEQVKGGVGSSSAATATSNSAESSATGEACAGSSAPAAAAAAEATTTTPISGGAGGGGLTINGATAAAR